MSVLSVSHQLLALSMAHPCCSGLCSCLMGQMAVRLPSARGRTFRAAVQVRPAARSAVTLAVSFAAPSVMVSRRRWQSATGAFPPDGRNAQMTLGVVERRRGHGRGRGRVGVPALAM